MPRNKTTPPAKAGGLWNTLERAAATVVALASPSAGNTESKTEKSRGKREPLAAAAAPKVNKRKSGREPAKPKEEDPQPAAKKAKVAVAAKSNPTAKSKAAAGPADPKPAAESDDDAATTDGKDDTPTLAAKLKSMPTSQLKLVYDIINKKRGLEMKEVVPRELCRSGNREYILKKLQKPHSTGGLYVADGELWDAIKDVLDYLAALPKKKRAPVGSGGVPKARGVHKEPKDVMGGSSAVKSKGGRPPRLELIPKGKPSYTASELNTMNTKELVSLFTETYGHATKSSNGVWLRKSLMHALGPAALAELALGDDDDDL